MSSEGQQHLSAQVCLQTWTWAILSSWFCSREQWCLGCSPISASAARWWGTLHGWDTAEARGSGLEAEPLEMMWWSYAWPSCSSPLCLQPGSGCYRREGRAFSWTPRLLTAAQLHSDCPSCSKPRPGSCDP